MGYVDQTLEEAGFSATASWKASSSSAPRESPALPRAYKDLAPASTKRWCVSSGRFPLRS